MKKNKKELTLALQGGGSHGAFTWGVLEKLFEEDVFNISGICGTSAGAINAGIAVYGYHKNGKHGAIDLLKAFWERVSQESIYSPIQPSIIDKMLSAGNMEFSAGYNFFNVMSNFLSPYQWNPLNMNPLRDILVDLIDFKALKESKMKLFTCATNVRTGEAKIFTLNNVSADTMLASACLPLLFKAVKVDNEYYWDGGYLGNPPMYPLIRGTDTNDILLVQTNPFQIKRTPKKADEILHRINELSFNSSLIAELWLIEFKNKLLADGYDMGGQLRKINYHVICADSTLEEFDVSSKSNTSWDFLNLLRNKGREEAALWLKDNYDSIGKKTTAEFSFKKQHEVIE
ncbi:MAG: patatin-like phospholipase family protein [Bacteroidia bacterium]